MSTNIRKLTNEIDINKFENKIDRYITNIKSESENINVDDIIKDIKTYNIIVIDNKNANVWVNKEVSVIMKSKKFSLFDKIKLFVKSGGDIPGDYYESISITTNNQLMLPFKVAVKFQNESLSIRGKELDTLIKLKMIKEIITKNSDNISIFNKPSAIYNCNVLNYWLEEIISNKKMRNNSSIKFNTLSLYDTLDI